MPLRPDEIENREFASSLRGFDKHEVRAFLRRVASDVDELEARLAREAAQGDDDASAEPEIISLVQRDEDRFAALGDRIANLLRQAHEAAAETRQQSEERAFQLRSSAEDELEAARVQASRFREEAEAAGSATRAQAEEEADRLRGEADRIRSETQRFHDEAQAVRHEADEYVGRLRGEAESDAVAIRDRAELEGAARLDDRRSEIAQAEARVEAERQAALAEVSQARAQVSSLLEEARAQSEFIKREAEEIIRAKVRNNIDQAQRRIDLLRNTETSSRNRIVTAQRELEAALSRLDAETVPELGNQTEEDVLVEAEERAVEADYPPFRSVSAGDGRRAGDYGSDEVIEGEVIEGDLAEEDVVEGDLAEGEVIEGDVVEGDLAEGEVVEGVPGTSYHPSAEGHVEAAGHDEGDLSESGPTAERPPENEDVLARLVREAMQRAVEGARNENH